MRALGQKISTHAFRGCAVALPKAPHRDAFIDAPIETLAL
jgi:hypothetical protein